MRPKSNGGRRARACLQPFAARLRGEDGIALVMAIGIMLVLTIALTTTIFLAAAGARDAHRTNASQKATALAEAGINDAVAVLNKNYPAATFPGNPNLLPATTTTYSTGKVTWSGSLVQSPIGAGWPYQWNITAVGDVVNPTGPSTPDVTRRMTAVVPVSTPTTWQQGSGQSAINFIYALHDITFQQSVVVEAPVYANGNLHLENTAWISENVPASVTNAAHPNILAVGGTLTLDNQYDPSKGPNNNGNHIGEWIPDSSGQTTYSHESSSGALYRVYVAGNCSSKNHTASHSPCDEGDGTWPNPSRDPIYSQNQSGGSILTTFPPPPDPTSPTDPTKNFVTTTPNMTCCYPVAASGVASNATPQGQCPCPPANSYMGFWYLNADLGPREPCDPTSSTGSYPRFDTPASSGTNYSDGTMNLSAPTFNLTGAAYDCKSSSGHGEISWDPVKQKFYIKGTIFFDGSLCINSGTGCGSGGGSGVSATYTGSGSIILTGTFTETNGNAMCVGLSGGGCNQSVSWDPNNASLGIIAYGNDGSGNSIDIKQGQIQGLLMGYNNIYCEPATGTFVQGPMISVDASINCGNSNILSFPAISFPSTGFSGSTGPLPPAVLSPPVQFGGG